MAKKRKRSKEFSRAQLVGMLAAARGIITSFQTNVRAELDRLDGRSEIYDDLLDGDRFLEDTGFDVDEGDLVNGGFDKSWQRERD